MSDTTHEAPERIWAWGWRADSVWQEQTWQHEDEPMSTMEYVRFDLMETAEQQGYANAMEAERKLHEDRIEAQAAEIERLRDERERLALAICGGEDAPGYANAQTIEMLEKVARDNHNTTMEQIDRTWAFENKLKLVVEAWIKVNQHEGVIVECHGDDAANTWNALCAALAELTGGKDAKNDM